MSLWVRRGISYGINSGGGALNFNATTLWMGDLVFPWSLSERVFSIVVLNSTTDGVAAADPTRLQ